ncbi:MAG: hypothetical protein ACYCUM_09515 [Solirubrobacteraceae bacterium]
MRVSVGVGRRALLARLLVVVLGCAGAVALLLLGGHVEALKAAGLAGGSAINGVSSLFTALTSNLLWLGVTAIGFAVMLVAILFLSGHHPPHEIALKIALGVFLLIAAPGIVS